MKKFISMLAITSLVFAFTACGGKEEAPADETTKQVEEQADEKEENKEEVKEDETVKLNGAFVDGTYYYEDAEFDAESGFKNTLDVTVENGKITAVDINGIKEDGSIKKDLVQSGDYDMSVAGATSTWTEQANAMEAYIIENQSFDVTVDEDGKTDAIASVTISVSPYTNLFQSFLAESTAEVVEEVEVGSTVYTYAASDFDSKTGFKDTLTITLENDEIVAVDVNAVNADGKTKKELVAAGEYDMSVAGATSTWTEQANAMEAFILENQNFDVAVNGEGKTDAIASVTVSVNGYVDLYKEFVSETSK